MHEAYMAITRPDRFPGEAPYPGRKLGKLLRP